MPRQGQDGQSKLLDQGCKIIRVLSDQSSYGAGCDGIFCLKTKPFDCFETKHPAGLRLALQKENNNYFDFGLDRRNDAAGVVLPLVLN